MTDYLELDSLFQKTNMVDEPQYEKVEFIQLPDEQGGVYDSGEISFNTQMIEKSNAVLSESYFALPLRVNLNDNKKIAIKNSLLSLIHGIDIRSTAGTTIANDSTGSTAALANLKLLIDSSTDFHEGNELMFFGKDQYIDPDVARDGVAKTAHFGVQAGVSSAVPDINPLHNPALANRISVFHSRANDFKAIAGAAPAGFREFIAMIPLKFIHDWFAQMHFPLPNLSLRITFRIAGMGGGSSYCPFTCPSVAAHRICGLADGVQILNDVAGVNPTKDEFNNLLKKTLAVNIDPADKPTLSVQATVTDKFKWMSKPSLYIKTVFFRPEEALQLAKSITEGFEKKIVFTVSQAYPYVQTSAKVNQQIATSVIRPTRMWVMPLPTGTLRSQTNSFPAVIGPNSLTNFNIQMNGNNFYQNEFRSQYQFYREFKTQLISAGASTMCGTPISYDDFLNGMNPYVFDLSRNPTVKSNNPNTLTVVCDVKDDTKADISTSYDLYVIIERLVTCTLKVSAGGIVVLTKDGADI